MKLFDLMKNVPFTGITENLEISRVTSDSRQITPGCLFVCIAGARFDGHSAAEQVLKEGAAAVVCERDRAGSATFGRGQPGSIWYFVQQFLWESCPKNEADRDYRYQWKNDLYLFD